MASGTIELRVLTDAGLAIQDRAVSIRAPGAEGSLGMLHNHAPLVTTLVPGKLIWRTPDGRTHEAQIGSGLLEIVHNRCTILTSTFAASDALHA